MHSSREHSDAPPDAAVRAVLRPSASPVEAGDQREIACGCNGDHSVHDVLRSMRTLGFQATAYARARSELQRMVHMRTQGDGCTIFLALTSNLVSSGVRESVRQLACWGAVDCVVTTAGGVEEDLVKCLGPTLLGSFALDGASLRSHGLNRAGNLLIPNDNYCAFEDWLSPLLHQLHSEQHTERGAVWSPSAFIDRLGKAMDSDDSIMTWCHRNRIPVFCPALTDGSLGDMLYFHSYKHPGFILDIVQDVRKLNDLAVHTKPPASTGMIILGGGVAKHHTCNANLMRNGAEYAVYINTGSEYDGSDSGASPDEAVSWGKISTAADPVKVHADATLVFPLLVAETFTPVYSNPDSLVREECPERSVGTEYKNCGR